MGVYLQHCPHELWDNFKCYVTPPLDIRPSNVSHPKRKLVKYGAVQHNNLSPLNSSKNWIQPVLVGGFFSSKFACQPYADRQLGRWGI